MVNLCGSNFVPILITLICCAGLFMYFNLRLAEIKVAVEKQNRVLTAFITNVQQDIRSGGGMLPSRGGAGPGACAEPSGSDSCVGMNHLAAPEALIAAQKFDNGKIVVSDDEDSDSESESDSDSDDECEGEEVYDVVAVKNIITISELQDLNVEQIIPLSFEVLPRVLDLSCDSDTETAFDLSITEIIDGSLNQVGETAYGDMKVDELRKIVADKSLATKDEVTKLQKPELLLLLKK